MKTRKASSPKQRALWQRIAMPFALISLLFAWWIGFSQQIGLSHTLASHFNTSSLLQDHERDYRFTLQQEPQGVTLPIYAASANGYGGPLVMAFDIDETHRIRNATLVTHVDTAGYVVNVMNQRFLDRINGITITQAMVINQDIDGVSGATLTVVGMSEAVRKAAHEEAIARGLSVDGVETSLRFQWADAMLTVLVLMVLFERKMPSLLRKYHIMVVGILSVVVIGFWANMALSTAALSSLLLGYWPDPRQNPSLYILLFTITLGIIWLGKNLYCSQLCPFHHIQRWLHKLGKNNFAVSEWINVHGVQVVNILLWLALMLIFVTRNPAIASYEPFSMLFSLDGVGVQWYILPLALTGSFFIKDYWCRLFCPLGRGLNLMVEHRQQARKWWRSRNKSAQRAKQKPKRRASKTPASKGIICASTAGYGLTLIVILLFMFNGVQL